MELCTKAPAPPQNPVGAMEETEDSVSQKWSHWDSRLRVRARPPPPGEAPGGTRGPSHMHAAVNNRLLAVWGLLNLLTQLRDLQRST